METKPLIVVGAGVAGTAAAIEAARLGVDVTLIDENPSPTSLMALNVPQLFGERFQDVTRDQSAMMARMTATNEALVEADRAGVEIQLGTCVWGAFRNSENSRNLDGPQIGLSDYERSWMLKYERLIVASGSRDLGIGFAGWELEGCMGASGVNSLVSCHQTLSARRVVVLGSGDLGLYTAKTALDNGVEVAAIVDVSPFVRGDSALLSALQRDGVEIHTSHALKKAVGTGGEIETVVLVEIDGDEQPVAGSEKSISADTVCLAIGLVPNIELLSLLGCAVAYKPELGGYVPNHDEWMRTSVDTVFVAGDVAGFHDAMVLNPEIARNQGRIAGIAAAESLGAIDEVEVSRRRSDIEDQTLGTELVEQHLVWKKWMKSLGNASGSDIFACRCEGVTRADIVGLNPPRYLGWDSEQMNGRNLRTQLQDNSVNPNQIKRFTRAGTGVCQGRHCREQVALLLAEESNTDVSNVPLMTYRAPVRPLPLNVMWPEDELEDVRNEWPKWFSPASKVLG